MADLAPPPSSCAVTELKKQAKNVTMGIKSLKRALMVRRPAWYAMLLAKKWKATLHFAVTTGLMLKIQKSAMTAIPKMETAVLPPVNYQDVEMDISTQMKNATMGTSMGVMVAARTVNVKAAAMA